MVVHSWNYEIYLFLPFQNVQFESRKQSRSAHGLVVMVFDKPMFMLFWGHAFQYRVDEDYGMWDAGAHDAIHWALDIQRSWFDYQLLLYILAVPPQAPYRIWVIRLWAGRWLVDGWGEYKGSQSIADNARCTVTPGLKICLVVLDSRPNLPSSGPS